MSHKNFNDLPNECIQLVLALFPLNSLLPLRAVCHRWLDQITGLCAARIELKLFASRVNFDEYRQDIHKFNLIDEPEFFHSNDVFYVSYVGEEIWHFLVQLFPRITKVIFYLETVNNLEHFLRQLSNQIQNLTIFGPLPLVPRLLEQVWTLLNSCTQLRRLHLFDLFDLGLPEQFPLLDQLEHLSLFRHENRLHQTLSQLGPNCTSLTFGLCRVHESSLMQAQQNNPVLFQSLTHLRLSQIFISICYGLPFCPESSKNVFKYFSENCPNLKSLDVITLHLEPDQIALRQANLQNLTTLHVRIKQIFNDFTEQLRFPNISTLIVANSYLAVTEECLFIFQKWLPIIFAGLEELRLVFRRKEVLDFVRQRIVPRIEFQDKRQIKISYRLDENDLLEKTFLFFDYRF